MFVALAFWCAAAGLWVVGQLVPPELVRLRAGAIAAVSGVAVALTLGLEARQVALLAAAIAWTVVATWRCKPDPRGAPSRIALAVIFPVLAVWTAGKIATANHQPFAWLFFLGSSFLLVKAFSLIKDRLEGKIDYFDPVVGIAYLTFLPTYLSGPMHAYDEFHTTITAPLDNRDRAVSIAFRFVWGLFKVSVISSILARASLTQLTTATRLPIGELVGAALIYSGVILANFSGYSDMAISLSAAIGVRTPENFDWPYLATSIREFWRRWHITFTRALTAHVFIPISRTLTRALPGRHPFLIPAIGYFAAFLFAGFWHGSTPNFLAWGAWHAVGLIGQDFWQKLGPAGRGPKGRPGATGLALRALKTAGTFVYVSLGWIFFVLPINELARLQWTMR